MRALLVSCVVAGCTASGGDVVGELPCSATSLATDGSVLYATTICDHGIYVVDLQRASTDLVLTRDVYPAAIAVTDNYVYWEQTRSLGASVPDGAVWRASKVTGAIEELASEQDPLGTPGNLVVDSSRVYWSDRYDVKAVLLEGGAALTIASAPCGPFYGLTTDNVFMSDCATLYRVPKGGGESTLIADFGPDSPALANAIVPVQDGVVVWAVYPEDGYEDDRAFLVHPDATVTAITTPTSAHVPPWATDGRFAYWSNAAEMFATSSSGSVEVASTSGIVSAIAVDSERVYWSQMNDSHVYAAAVPR